MRSTVESAEPDQTSACFFAAGGGTESLTNLAGAVGGVSVRIVKAGEVRRMEVNGRIGGAGPEGGMGHVVAGGTNEAITDYLCTGDAGGS